MAKASGNNEALLQRMQGQNGKNGKNGNPAVQTVKQLLNAPATQARFREILRDRAPQFMSSIVNLVNSDPNLQKCEPMSIIAACMVAATMDLPIDKNLGYAWIVPYKDNKTGRTVAQFQLGYKGYVQLALRTGQYRYINVIEVYKGELKKYNRLTEELEIDESARESDEVIGYAAFFELLNGFKKTVYWPKEKVIAHRDRFSKQKDGKVWREDFDAMAMKTVLKNMLAKWGILSIEMQKAVTTDEATPVTEGAEDPMDVEWQYVDQDAEDTEQAEQTEGANPETDEATETEGAREVGLGIDEGDVIE
jgi:recombination protein RecT